MVAGAAWHPVAAYLYVLHLNGSSLAWEYLRRNPEYRQDWHRRRSQQARHWGLRLLEDPDLDARDARSPTGSPIRPASCTSIPTSIRRLTRCRSGYGICPARNACCTTVAGCCCSIAWAAARAALRSRRNSKMAWRTSTPCAPAGRC